MRLSTGLAVGAARTLLPWDKITKLTTSLVIQAPPTDAPVLIKNGILLGNRVSSTRAMWPSTPHPVHSLLALQPPSCWMPKSHPPMLPHLR